MASNSKIEWTDHTVNFWWGCTKVSPACAHCYAETMSRHRSKMFFGFLVEWGAGKARGERMEKAAAECWALDTQAMRKGVRYRVFVNSMSDWLDEEVPVAWLAKLLETIARCKHLDFQLLTKRPGNWRQRIAKAMVWLSEHDDDITSCWLTEWIGGEAPANVWVGTTVESQEWADRRVPELLKIPAVVRFLSCEPLVVAVDLRMGQSEGEPTSTEPLRERQHLLHWVIAGGESGGQARALHPGWVKSLRDQCQAAGVPFFFKQWGEWVPQGERTAEPMAEDDLLRGHKHEDGVLMLRAGKKGAGAFLDGVEWKEMPARFAGLTEGAGVPPILGSAPGMPTTGTKASAAPCE
jgi:protein gp37